MHGKLSDWGQEAPIGGGGLLRQMRGPKGLLIVIREGPYRLETFSSSSSRLVDQEEARDCPLPVT